MPTRTSQKYEMSQSDKLTQAAPEFECDPDKARWEDKLHDVVMHKPLPEYSK